MKYKACMKEHLEKRIYSESNYGKYQNWNARPVS